MKRVWVLVLSLFILGCASISTRKFSQLQMGMSKEEVRKTLGNPYLYRTATNREEIWEYLVSDPYAIHSNMWQSAAPYWVTFINNKLVFYGQPGDFGSSGPDSKKEIIIKER